VALFEDEVGVVGEPLTGADGAHRLYEDALVLSEFAIERQDRQIGDERCPDSMKILVYVGEFASASESIGNC